MLRGRPNGLPPDGDLKDSLVTKDPYLLGNRISTGPLTKSALPIQVYPESRR
jgi:hypothetical protein